uniref:Retrotransposon gag domain-containing protein n=1 Tax=Acanthochromis polyacanthus TaxID=80966 RepID=A0A3Q1FJ22_9TELE
MASQITHVSSAPEILDQHGRALHELATSAKNLHDQMENVHAQLNQLTSAMAQLTATQSDPAPPPPVPSSAPDPVSPPPAFREPHKISHTLSLLSGAGLRWGSAVWQKNGPACRSYAAFTEEMRQVFDHPVQGAEAEKRLGALTQGGQSVAEYAVEFQTLAASCDWNDAALRYSFHHGLNDELKDQLASKEETTDLKSLIDLAIRLDNRLRERRREKTQSRSYPGTPSISSPHWPTPPLGRARLTEEEKAVGHYSNTCPAKLGKDVAHRGGSW